MKGMHSRGLYALLDTYCHRISAVDLVEKNPKCNKLLTDWFLDNEEYLGLDLIVNQPKSIDEDNYIFKSKCENSYSYSFTKKAEYSEEECVEACIALGLDTKLIEDFRHVTPAEINPDRYTIQKKEKK